MNQLTQTCPQTATDELVDIREVAVDKDLPKEERIAAFLHQIKNPYRFRCGDFVVNAAFAQRGHIGGMPARDFKVIDILALFPKACYDVYGKG